MMISVRIVLTDYYVNAVNSQFDMVYSKLRHQIKQVPILRIFGPNEEGKKVCLHLNGVFPYLLVKSPTDEIRYGEQLAQSLDMAINLSLGKGDLETKHVHDINLIELLPIYGYHGRAQNFWKIEFYNPVIIRKAADLLLGGAVMNQEFQPHEAHVPLNLQFFIDYNLYGMNFIVFNNASPRQSSRAAGNKTYLTDISITNDDTNISNMPRVSSCELEYDVHINDICNESPQIGQGIANPGLQALWEGERTRRVKLNISDRLSPPTSPERPRTNPFAAETRHREKLKANIEKRPPPEHESPRPSSLVNDNDTTVNMAQIQRVNSMSQQVDDEVLVQMMVNDEISDSQGIESDSVLCVDIKPLDDDELLDDNVQETTINNAEKSILDPDIESDSLIVPSPMRSISNEPSSQTSEQEREETKKLIEDFFLASANHDDDNQTKFCWLETVARPPMRRRTTNALHQKISTQIICQDIEDETPFVKLFSNIPEFTSKHCQRTVAQRADEEKLDINRDISAQWYGPLQPPPEPEYCKSIVSKKGSSKKPADARRSRPSLLHKDSTKTSALLNKCGVRTKSNSLISNISGPTLNNTHGFRVDQFNKDDLVHECQFLTVLSFELVCHTDEPLAFAIDKDEICCIFYTSARETRQGWQTHSSVLISSRYFHTKSDLLQRCIRSYEGKTFELVADEVELMERFSNIVEEIDPDIVICYDMKLALYYLIKRAKQKYNLDLLVKLSRIPSQQEGITRVRNHMGADGNDVPVIVGRVVLDLWKIIRSEIILNIYTFENVVYHVLHERVPHYKFNLLSKWFSSEGIDVSFALRDLISLLDYGWTHSAGNFRLIYELDLINKTSEFARIYGIEFYHVLSRGSQYRVESMMIRLAKCWNFVTVTPDNMQRLHMRAPECIPLTLEPISTIYFSPIAVLDFQSLYPSIIIAYNLCFSTCLGRIDQLHKQGSFKFGCTSLTIPDRVLTELDLETDIFCSPNGVAFVGKHKRRGILPVMLEEILATRVMIKNTMKLIDKKSTLYRTLDARQLCLKLIANVTFGYTSANFSGRMPAVELGDTIVHTARTVLERAIEFIKMNPQFGGRVVYGDTDSLFVQFPHSTRAHAFEQSHLLVKAINQMYPSPIKIKFEKIYMQSVLASKKRYVGMSYETVDQIQGKFDAKGIETVRRDTCAVVAKLLESSLKILFQTKDITRVRRFIQSECQKIIANRVNLLDFVFAKEYRGKATYHATAPVPSLRIAMQRAMNNPLAEPNQGERVPYIIGYNPEIPNANLIDCVWPLDDVLTFKSQFKLNTMYYIKKQILPALDRCLALIGVNVFKWIDDLPAETNLIDKHQQQQPQLPDEGVSNNLRRRCVLCAQLSSTPLCNECREDDLSETMIICESKANKLERQHAGLQRICLACTDRNDGWFTCSTTDCPVRFRTVKMTQLMQIAQETRMFVDNEC